MPHKAKTTLHESYVSLWYEFLQLADAMGIEIDWKFYEAWGSKGELTTKKFGTWWRERGRDLFTEKEVIEVIDANRDYITIKIPSHFSIKRIRSEIGSLYGPHRNTTIKRGSGSYVVDGRVSYSRLVTYKRLLKIDLDSKKSGKRVTMGEKLKSLAEGEKKREEIAKKASHTASKNALAKGKKRAESSGPSKRS